MRNEINVGLNFASATEVRKEWSAFFDKAMRVEPVFIKRTRDVAVLTNLKFIDSLLEKYSFECTEYQEDDGTITLSANDLDLVENGATEADAKDKMAASILEYATEFYNEFEYWGSAPNRQSHIPYVFKALLLNDTRKIGEQIHADVERAETLL